jgi:chemotaxis protein methyltransferase CheR
MYSLNQTQFSELAKIIYDFSRIHLSEKKKPLVISRLSKRIRKLGLANFSEYLSLIRSAGPESDEFTEMINSISTNYSHFFRESYHFDFLVSHYLTPLKQEGSNPLCIWSAAASTGQEVYSLLICLEEFKRIKNPHLRYQLYASDISSKVLNTASSGLYKIEETQKISKEYLKTYFLRGKGSYENQFKVKNQYIKQIKFFKFNLNSTQYDVPPMDIVFLRNALIYFDRPTKQQIINRLYDILPPEGLLFLGHSESLAGISSKFKLVGRTIYKKVV